MDGPLSRKGFVVSEVLNMKGTLTFAGLVLMVLAVNASAERNVRMLQTSKKSGADGY